MTAENDADRGAFEAAWKKFRDEAYHDAMWAPPADFASGWQAALAHARQPGEPVAGSAPKLLWTVGGNATVAAPGYAIVATDRDDEYGLRYGSTIISTHKSYEAAQEAGERDWQRRCSAHPAPPAPVAVPDGFVLVPEMAIKWLLGEGPDENGDWFGDVTHAKGAFWWRADFQRMLSAAPVPPAGGDVRALREALAPFADMADLIDAETEGFSDTDEFDVTFGGHLFLRWPVSHFRRARAALATLPAESGEVRSAGIKIVPRHPTDEQVSEILHNINRKRRDENELSAFDVREVVDTLFYVASSTLPAEPEGEEQNWRDDPAADERWNAGCDFAMQQLCAVVGIDPQEVNWDAATETVDGDVRSVIRDIMETGLGEYWQDRCAIHPTPAAEEAFRRGAEADEPDAEFQKWVERDTIGLTEYDKKIARLVWSAIRLYDKQLTFSPEPGDNVRHKATTGWKGRVVGPLVLCARVRFDGDKSETLTPTSMLEPLPTDKEG